MLISEIWNNKLACNFSLSCVCIFAFLGVHQAQASRMAEQHYQLQLKKKAWAAWQSLIQRGWRERAERACQARAEEVCLQLSADYEAKLGEVKGYLPILTDKY